MLAPVASACLGSFAFFAPDITQVMVADPDDKVMEKRVRVGEALGVGASLAAVAYIAHNSNNPRPYLYWLVGAGSLVLLYEAMHKRNKPEKDCGCDG